MHNAHDPENTWVSAHDAALSGLLGLVDQRGGDFGSQLGVARLCDDTQHAFCDSGRQFVGPSRHRLVGDAHGLGSSGYGAAEQFNGFLFLHAALKHAFFLDASMLSPIRVISPYMTYGTRLDQAIKLAKASRKALGEAMGISEQAVGMVIRGVSGAFNVENSAKAARFLRVDHHWLATGEGEPRPKSGWPFLSFGPAEYFSLDDDLRQEIEDRLLGAVVRTSSAKERRSDAA